MLDRLITFISWGVLILTALILALIASGCQPARPATNSTGPLMADLQTAGALVEAGRDEVRAAKPHASDVGRAHLGSADTMLSKVVEVYGPKSEIELEILRKGIEALEQDRDAWKSKYEDDKWLRRLLQWTAYLCFAAATACIIAAIFLSAIRSRLLIAAGSLFLGGAVFTAIVTYIGPITIAALCLLGMVALMALVAAAFWLRSWWNDQKARKIVESMEAAKGSGLVITPEAAKVIDKVQGPFVRAFVDEVQKHASR